MKERREINSGMVHMTLGLDGLTLCDQLVGIKDDIKMSKPYRFTLHTLDTVLTTFGRAFTTCYSLDFHSMRAYMESKKVIAYQVILPVPEDYGFRRDL